MSILMIAPGTHAHNWHAIAIARGLLLAPATCANICVINLHLIIERRCVGAESASSCWIYTNTTCVCVSCILWALLWMGSVNYGHVDSVLRCTIAEHALPLPLPTDRLTILVCCVCVCVLVCHLFELCVTHMHRSIVYMDKYQLKVPYSYSCT